MNRKIHRLAFWSWITTLAVVSLTTTLSWQNVQTVNKVYQVKSKQVLKKRSDQQTNATEEVFAHKKQTVSTHPYLEIRADGTVTGVTAAGKEQRELIIPESVNAIGHAAFKNCSNLQKVSLAKTVTKIAELAFEDCRNLRAITIPETVTEISADVFVGCNALTEDQLINNSPILFDWWVNKHHYNGVLMTDLSSIDLSQYKNSAGKLFTKIAPRALKRCTNLREITIHREITDIGGENFDHCPLLKTEHVINYSPVLFDWWVRHHLYPQGTMLDVIVQNRTINLTDFRNSADQSFSCIGGRSFYLILALEEITLPKTILTIGDDAFLACRGLRRINLNKGLQRIGENAFDNCRALLSINLPSTLTQLGDGAFKYCTMLTSVGIFARIEQIGYGTFGFCRSLQNINIPNTITAIRDRAFNHCRSLKNLTLPESINEIGQNAFSNCVSLQKINLPENLTELSRELFANCQQLAKINIPQNVYEICDAAFADCKDLVQIVIPKKTKILGEAIFSGTEQLKRIYILGTHLSFDPSLISGINQFVKFYVADSWLMSQLKAWGIDQSRIHPLKPRTLTFLANDHVVELKPNFNSWNEVQLTKTNKLFTDIGRRLKTRKLRKKHRVTISKQKFKKQLLTLNKTNFKSND